MFETAENILLVVYLVVFLLFHLVVFFWLYVVSLSRTICLVYKQCSVFGVCKESARNCLQRVCKEVFSGFHLICILGWPAGAPCANLSDSAEAT